MKSEDQIKEMYNKYHDIVCNDKFPETYSEHHRYFVATCYHDILSWVLFDELNETDAGI